MADATLTFFMLVWDYEGNIPWNGLICKEIISSYWNVVFAVYGLYFFLVFSCTNSFLVVFSKSDRLKSLISFIESGDSYLLLDFLIGSLVLFSKFGMKTIPPKRSIELSDFVRLDIP